MDSQKLAAQGAEFIKLLYGDIIKEDENNTKEQ